VNFLRRLSPYLVVVLVIALFSGDFVELGSSTFRVIALISGTAFFLGFRSRVSVWMRSRPLRSSEVLRVALAGAFSRDCLLAGRVFRQSRVRGLVLLLTMWSFWILTLGSICHSLEYLLRADLMTSSGLFTVMMDCSGVALFLCVIFYLGRRFVVKTAREIAVMEDIVLLLTILLIVITGLANDGLAIAYAGISPHTMRPAGVFLAKGFLLITNRPMVLLKVKDVIWKVHALLAFFFLAYIPFSKQFHMFAAQIVTRDAERRNKELWSILHE
jgi:nitrate reductase gamma subunit